MANFILSVLWRFAKQRLCNPSSQATQLLCFCDSGKLETQELPPSVLKSGGFRKPYVGEKMLCNEFVVYKGAKCIFISLKGVEGWGVEGFQMNIRW